MPLRESGRTRRVSRAKNKQGAARSVCGYGPQHDGHPEKTTSRNKRRGPDAEWFFGLAGQISFYSKREGLISGLASIDASEQKGITSGSI